MRDKLESVTSDKLESVTAKSRFLFFRASQKRSKESYYVANRNAVSESRQ